jgi:hypothetical protein
VAEDVAGNQSTASLTFVIDKSGMEPVDDMPPVISILSPQEGAHLQSLAMLDTLISDALNGVNEAHYRIDGGAWLALDATVVAGQYVALPGALIDGAHFVEVSASDHAGNEAMPVSASFVIDATAPVIAIDGAMDGARYPYAITPLVTITDANLVFSYVRLNGVPYASGTEVLEEGVHVLSVLARDRAGNESFVSLVFEIVPPDTVLPVVSVVSPQDESYTGNLVMVRANALDPLMIGIERVEYRLNRSEWENFAVPPPGDPYAQLLVDLAEGLQLIEVRAHSVDGRVSETVRTRFTVDTIAPVIEVQGLTDMQRIELPSPQLVPDIRVIELNPDAEEAHVNGVPFVFGDALPLTPGTHTLEILAIDKAGNRSTLALNYMVVAAGTSITPIPVMSGFSLPILLLLLMYVTCCSCGAIRCKRKSS